MGGSELLSLHIPFVYPIIMRNPLESSFVGDHCGVCFGIIDRLIPELRMRKDLHRKRMPYKHMAIIFFTDFAMAIVAPRAVHSLKINFRAYIGLRKRI